MTAPLTPAGCDLRGYEFMPLYGHHLFGSDFNARVSDPGWRAAVTLWWAAWNQVPAASLPNDDIALTRLADLGRDLKGFRKIKAEALSGFVECDDGRLYHVRLSAWAIEAWDRRVKERDRKASWRAGHNQSAAGTETGKSVDKSGRGAGQRRDASPMSPSQEQSTEPKETGQPPGQRRDVPAEVKVSEVKVLQKQGLEVTTVPSPDEKANGKSNPEPRFSEIKNGKEHPAQHPEEPAATMLKLPHGWRTEDSAADQAGRLLGMRPGGTESYDDYRRRIGVAYEAYRLNFLGLRTGDDEARKAGQ